MGAFREPHVQIEVKDKKLRAALGDEAHSIRLYGAKMTKRLYMRVQALEAADSLATFWPPLKLPERIHELNRSTTVHLDRGTELEKVGRYAEAIHEHETALESDPNNVQVHVNLISLYARTGDSARARQLPAASEACFSI